MAPMDADGASDAAMAPVAQPPKGCKAGCGGAAKPRAGFAKPKGKGKLPQAQCDGADRCDALPLPDVKPGETQTPSRHPKPAAPPSAEVAPPHTRRRKNGRA